MTTITLGETEISITPPKLKCWLELEQIRIQLNTAVERKDIQLTGELLCAYVSTAVDVEVEELPWYETANGYVYIREACVPNQEFPILHAEPQEDDAWDYSGRDWYLWSHCISSSYGWSLECVGDLDFNDAIALIQEIFIEKQLEKEWDWSLSEASKTYNSTTKKVEFKPLPRPKWMLMGKIIEAPKPTKIPKHMMPVGNVIKMNEITKH